MKRLFLCLFVGIMWAEWVMFSDSTDTYLYNNQTGEIYIRHKQGGVNYKDIFVRMPNGVIPEGINSVTLPKSSTQKPTTQTTTQTPTIPLNDTNAAKKMLEEANKQFGNMLYEGN